jgi:hypothetical protein
MITPFAKALRGRSGLGVCLCLGFVFHGLALADNVLHPGSPVLDRPTLTAIGIKLPVTGDDNYNATVTVRYRKTGAATFSNALPLFHVHPDTTLPYFIEPQFSGSILDLRPATTYEIELHLTDPDGPVDRTFTLSATTRPVPGDPANPRNRTVTDPASLKRAFDDAQPGDIITLANGFYSGEFSSFNSGTAANPIVIRGASQSGVILDGSDCDPCNVLEVYGSWVHVERLTIQNGERAIRFQTAGAQGNVVRDVHTRDTMLGIGMKTNSKDFYIADNIMEGRIPWPVIYEDDNGKHSDEDGINVQGFGHVIAHNRLSGFGDAMKTSQDGARAVDFYGNDILWTYDNGVELDASESNARLLRNRFTNTYEPISGQPIHGGPAYIIRNVALNVVLEQLKLHSHSNPTTEPNGVFAYHNTFVSSGNALTLQTGTYNHHFAIENNLFIGPRNQIEDMTVDWYSRIDDGVFDYNGYWPDMYYAFNFPTHRLRVWGFAELQKNGIETHGVLLNPQTLANGQVGPDTYLNLLKPVDFTLASNSLALDRGLVLPNVNDGYLGTAPDLGAIELGCPAPIYGPRPDGIDETNQQVGCTASGPAPVPTPKSVAAVSGTPQDVQIQTTFLPLQALVLDTSSQPMAGVPVTFNAPTSGAGGAFGGNTSTVVNTDAQGLATVTQFVANNTPGSYAVVASVSGVGTSAAFNLTNTMVVTTTIAVPSTVVYSPAQQSLAASATVTGGSSAVTTGSVLFRANGNPFATVPVSGGTASSAFTVSGGTPAGTQFTFTAEYVAALGATAITGVISPAQRATVVKATPVITWPAPASISSGTLLGSAQLNATSSVPGVFVYTPPAGTALPAGNGQALTASLVPSDTTNYNTASASVTIGVTPPPVVKVTPVITWPAPASIASGTPLGSAQLNATANVSGVFVYAPPAGAVLPAGNAQSLTVSFTPNDSTNYNTASANVTIAVTAAVPPPVAVPPVVVVPPKFTAQGMLSRNANGEVTGNLRLINSGAVQAVDAVLRAVTLNGRTGTVAANQPVTLAPGASQTYSVTFPPVPGGDRLWGLMAISGTSLAGAFTTDGWALVF